MNYGKPLITLEKRQFLITSFLLPKVIFNYESNRPHFLWVYQLDNLRGTLGVPDPNKQVPHVKILTNPTRVSLNQPDILGGKSVNFLVYLNYSVLIPENIFPLSWKDSQAQLIGKETQ